MIRTTAGDDGYAATRPRIRYWYNLNRYFSANALRPCSSYMPKYSVDRLVGIEARRMFTDKAWIMLPAKATVDYSPSSTGTDPGTGLDCGTCYRLYVVERQNCLLRLFVS